MPTDARLLWIYLFTNPSASVAGIYRLPLRTIAFEVGLPSARVQELLAQFALAGKVFFEDGFLWIRKMREYQLPGRLSPQLRAHLEKEVAKVPACPLKDRYLEAYGYPIDTRSTQQQRPAYAVSLPRSTDTDTQTDTDTKTETETKPRIDTETLAVTETETRRKRRGFRPEAEDWTANLPVSDEYRPLIKEFVTRIHPTSASHHLPQMEERLAALSSRGVLSWWEMAIQVAEDMNKRTWAYVRGILDTCLLEEHPPYCE